ncbi:MAG: NrfD/PsrC family molybdoenzyme membrane anchor subunit [Nitrospinota bacterium]
MESIVLLTHKWSVGPQIPLYLLLGGMAGGLLLTSAVLDVFDAPSRRRAIIARLACYMAFPCIAVGGLVLASHLGKPERGIFFPLYFKNPRSWLVIGSWIIGVYSPICLGLTAMWFFEVRRAWRLILDALAIPVSIGLAMYTGALLSGAIFAPTSVPLWDPQHLPTMFLFSGITSGIAATGLGAIMARIVGWPRPIKRVAPDMFPYLVWFLCIPLVFFLVIESMELLSFIQDLQEGTPGQKVVHAYLTSKSMAPWLWGGVFGVGIGVPMMGALACLATGRRAVLITFPTFSLVLVGALIFRFVIVWGGEVKKPLVFPPQKWPVPNVQVAPGTAEALGRALGRVQYNK